MQQQYSMLFDETLREKTVRAAPKIIRAMYKKARLSLSNLLKRHCHLVNADGSSTHILLVSRIASTGTTSTQLHRMTSKRVEKRLHSACKRLHLVRVYCCQ